MEDLKSNAEIRAETKEWVDNARRSLDADRSRKLAITGPFRDPWSHAVAISVATNAHLRWREAVPNPKARLRCIQVAHANNLLDWPDIPFVALRVRPDNLFNPPSRAEMLERLEGLFGDEISVGDIVKIEGGWAVMLCKQGPGPGLSTVELPETIAGFTLRALLNEEIELLPACTQTGSITATTASARIDAVSAAVLKPSREQVKRHLESGGVLLNYQPVGKSGKELAPGDVVAVRNAGRYRLEELMGETKKGRVRIKAEILNGG
jgi:RNA-binding protein YlmH